MCRHRCRVVGHSVIALHRQSVGSVGNVRNALPNVESAVPKLLAVVVDVFTAGIGRDAPALVGIVVERRILDVIICHINPLGCLCHDSACPSPKGTQQKDRFFHVVDGVGIIR